MIDREKWLKALTIGDLLNIKVGNQTFVGKVAGFDSRWQNQNIHEIRVSYVDENGMVSEQIVPLVSGMIDQVSIQ
jgi:hypothetical protein